MNRTFYYLSLFLVSAGVLGVLPTSAEANCVAGIAHAGEDSSTLEVVRSSLQPDFEVLEKEDMESRLGFVSPELSADEVVEGGGRLVEQLDLDLLVFVESRGANDDGAVSVRLLLAFSQGTETLFARLRPSTRALEPGIGQVIGKLAAACEAEAATALANPPDQPATEEARDDDYSRKQTADELRLGAVACEVDYSCPRGQTCGPDGTCVPSDDPDSSSTEEANVSQPTAEPAPDPTTGTAGVQPAPAGPVNEGATEWLPSMHLLYGVTNTIQTFGISFSLLGYGELFGVMSQFDFAGIAGNLTWVRNGLGVGPSVLLFQNESNDADVVIHTYLLAYLDVLVSEDMVFTDPTFNFGGGTQAKIWGLVLAVESLVRGPTYMIKVGFDFR